MVDLLALLAGAALGLLLGVAVVGLRRSAGPAPAPAPSRRPAPPPRPGSVPPRPAVDYPIHVNRPSSAPSRPPVGAVAVGVASGGRLERSDGGEVVVLGPEPVTIGRGTDQVVQVEDRRASRAHAVVRPRAKGGWELADVGSANGTELNGHRIPDGRVAPLRDGDRIVVGETTITYREGGGPAPSAPPAPPGPDATQVL